MDLRYFFSYLKKLFQFLTKKAISGENTKIYFPSFLTRTCFAIIKKKMFIDSGQRLLFSEKMITYAAQCKYTIFVELLWWTAHLQSTITLMLHQDRLCSFICPFSVQPLRNGISLNLLLPAGEVNWQNNKATKNKKMINNILNEKLLKFIVCIT